MHDLGYPQFFNSETLECNERSFGFWRFGFHPLLTVEKRRTINSLVRLMNEHIELAVDRVNVIRGPNTVLFVTVDDQFENHRFCDPGVADGDAWSFLPNGKDNIPSLSPIGEPANLTPAQCDTALANPVDGFGSTWGVQSTSITNSCFFLNLLRRKTILVVFF